MKVFNWIFVCFNFPLQFRFTIQAFTSTYRKDTFLYQTMFFFLYLYFYFLVLLLHRKWESNGRKLKKKKEKFCNNIFQSLFSLRVLQQEKKEYKLWLNFFRTLAWICKYIQQHQFVLVTIYIHTYILLTLKRDKAKWRRRQQR